MIKKTVLIILVFLFAIMGLYAADDGDVITDPGQDTETPKLTVTLSIEPEYYVAFTSDIYTKDKTLSAITIGESGITMNQDGTIDGEVWASIDTNQSTDADIQIGWNYLKGSEGNTNTIPLTVEQKKEAGNSPTVLNNTDVGQGTALTGPDGTSYSHVITIEEETPKKLGRRRLSYQLTITADASAIQLAPNDTYTSEIYMILNGV